MQRIRRCDIYFIKASFEEPKEAPAKKGSRKAFRINDLREEEEQANRSSR